MAQLLEERGVQLEVIIDEGGTIASDGFSFIRQPVAFVATAEKVRSESRHGLKELLDSVLECCSQGHHCMLSAWKSCFQNIIYRFTSSSDLINSFLGVSVRKMDFFHASPIF